MSATSKNVVLAILGNRLNIHGPVYTRRVDPNQALTFLDEESAIGANPDAATRILVNAMNKGVLQPIGGCIRPSLPGLFNMQQSPTVGSGPQGSVTRKHQTIEAVNGEGLRFSFIERTKPCSIKTGEAA